ncbi:ABC transporter substrate-binding protein [Aquamicrobium ahrensii]|uniref:Peptide/nickel transport system substrate-binding protein n=1 Tax=Aquamicrobium ahrensii TaxID=469551 RepID=A0ABV2KQG7_9HYPH
MFTRRRFMQSTAAIGLLAQSGFAFAQTQADKQDLHVGMAYDDMGSIDPHTAVTSIAVPIVREVYEGLLAYPSGFLGDAEIMPALAESWEASEDKKSWTFHLRQGVQWHGGYGEFTSADAKFSIERVTNQEFGSPFRSAYANVKQVIADEPYTLVIELENPDARFDLRLVNFQAGFIVCKKAIEEGADIKSHPIGTGPFEFEAYAARQSLTLKANESYWGGKPILDRMIWHFIPDNSTRELSLNGGEVHAIDLEARQQVVDRIRAQGMTVDLAKEGTPYWLFINLTIKPFDDLRVRQALAYAINRDDLVSYLGKDLAVPEYSAIPAGYLGHIDDMEKYSHDVERAKALLAEAGHESGFSFEMAMSNSPLYLPYMQIIQEQWRAIGVNVTFRVVDHPTYHRLIRENTNPIVMYQATRYPKTAQIYLDQFYVKSAAIGKETAITNFIHYGDVLPGIDDLADKARFSADPDEQNELWAEAQRRIANDAVTIPLFNQNAARARSPLVDLQMPAGNLSFYMFSKDTRILDE